MAVNSGLGFALIDHAGDVYPDGFLPMHFGDLKETHFPEIYSESPVFKELRGPDNRHGKCSVCGFHNVCGGSRSTAFALTGDHRAADPTCAYVPPAWHPDADVVEGEGATSADRAGIGSVPGGDAHADDTAGTHTPTLKLTVVDDSKGM